MELMEIISKARAVKERYSLLQKRQSGKEWGSSEFMSGFVGDVGDLSKLVMAKNGLRVIPDVDAKLAHELGDCLWSIIVLADSLNINLEEAFINTMDELNNRLK